MEPVQEDSEDSPQAEEWSVEYADESTNICKWKVKFGDVDEDFPLVCFTSPTFWHSESTKWCMEIMKVAGSFYLLLRLMSAKRALPVKAVVKASVMWQTNDVITGRTKTEKHEKNKSCDIDRSAILTFHFTVNCLEKDFTVHCHLTITPEISKPNMSHTLQKHTHILCSDLSNLLTSGHMSDLVLHAGGTELRAHRLLLSARSPVFAAMLNHDTQENQTGSIHIEDVGPGALRELLCYVYTGRAPRLEAMADQLLVAADKYGLDGLKELCEEQLINSLTVDNAALAAVTAVRHSCDLLKPAVMGFIRKNLLPVLGSAGWANVTREYTEVVIELNQLLAGKSYC